jgi:hypothetical protein
VSFENATTIGIAVLIQCGGIWVLSNAVGIWHKLRRQPKLEDEFVRQGDHNDLKARVEIYRQESDDKLRRVEEHLHGRVSKQRDELHAALAENARVNADNTRRVTDALGGLQVAVGEVRKSLESNDRQTIALDQKLHAHLTNHPHS